jgi:hypothetical protein
MIRAIARAGFASVLAIGLYTQSKPVFTEDFESGKIDPAVWVPLERAQTVALRQQPGHSRNPTDKLAWFSPSIKSAPRVVFFAPDFLGILLCSFQMNRDLPQLLLLVRGQIRLHVLGITPHQVNARGDHDVKVNDSGATTLSFALRCPLNFRTPPDPGITSPASGRLIR